MDFPPGSRIFRPDIPAVVINREGKILAFSLSCTHLGCALEDSGEGFSCPCHGSQFDAKGRVVKGPAEDNLRELRWEFGKDQTLMLYTKKGAGK
jgi:Rieske Fe-S protein